MATSAPESEAGVLVVRRHHLPVRRIHWLSVPILPGLVLSGMSIYWLPPVYSHKPDLALSSRHVLAISDR